MLTTAVWNNKGGTGKTSLTFQLVCQYAINNPERRFLVIDMCPQANISELFLGGIQNNGSQKLLEQQGMIPRCSIGGYFDIRLPSAHNVPSFNPKHFITKPSNNNSEIPENIDLVCGDPLLELQAIAMNTLANIQLPGVNTWIAVIDWLSNFLDQIRNDYDFVFIDTNPSFSMYTQIALAAADRVILPVMADDSSRRAIQNAFSLIYGVELPSKVYTNYTFANKMKEANRELPKVHLILKNRLTQYMGTASAFEAVLKGIDKDLRELLDKHGKHFTFHDIARGIVEIRDFSTTGVIAFAKGRSFTKMTSGSHTISGKDRPTKIHKKNIDSAVNAINEIIGKL